MARSSSLLAAAVYTLAVASPVAVLAAQASTTATPVVQVFIPGPRPTTKVVYEGSIVSVAPNATTMAVRGSGIDGVAMLTYGLDKAIVHSSASHSYVTINIDGNSAKTTAYTGYLQEDITCGITLNVATCAGNITSMAPKDLQVTLVRGYTPSVSASMVPVTVTAGAELLPKNGTGSGAALSWSPGLVAGAALLGAAAAIF